MDYAAMAKKMGGQDSPFDPTQIETGGDPYTSMAKSLGGSLTPDQSAAVLGHSTQIMLEQMRQNAAKAQAQSEYLNSSLGTAIETAKGVGETLISGETGVAEDITAALPQSMTGVREAEKAQQRANQSDIQFIEMMNKRKQEGKKLTQSQQAIYDKISQGVEQKAPTALELTPGITKSNLEVGLDFAGLASDVLGGGSLSRVGEKGISRLAERRAINAVRSTSETMTTKEEDAAIKAGRQLGGGKFKPTTTEKRAAEILGKRLSGNPMKNVKMVDNEISNRGKEAEQFLGENGVPIPNWLHEESFAKARTEIEKAFNPTELKYYEEQIQAFSRFLPGKGNYNTATYYKALKEYENKVVEHLPKGKDALLTEGGAARLQGARDVRKVVRELIGELNPEFKGKMFDLASLYEARDTIAIKARKLDTFGKRHPKLVKGSKAIGKGIGTAAIGAAGAGGVIEGQKLLSK